MPNSLIDLHIHSYYSDGRASPAEIMHHAAGLGLKTVALTDHDTLGGLAEAENVAARLGMEFIPAVELTTTWDGPLPTGDSQNGKQDVDLLAYFIDPHQAAFRDYVQEGFTDLLTRIEHTLALLSETGLHVSMEELHQVNPRFPGLTGVADTLQHKGYASDRRSAMDLAYHAYRQGPPSSHTVSQTVQAIHSAGGAAVLAHPVAIDLGRGWIGEAEIAWLVSLGIDGLEVNHPRLDHAARQHFLGLAHHYGLLTSGGSDEHGWPSGFPRLGSEPVGYEAVHALRAAAGRAGGLHG